MRTFRIRLKMGTKIIEEVKEELGLSYVPEEPMELAIKKERDRWIKKFNEYSCIKNDKWYLDWLEEISPKT